MTTKPVLRVIQSVKAVGAVAVPVSRGVRRWMRDDTGITAIEYALLGSLIALAIIGAVSGLGTTIGNVFNDIASSI